MSLRLSNLRSRGFAESGRPIAPKNRQRAWRATSRSLLRIQAARRRADRNCRSAVSAAMGATTDLSQRVEEQAASLAETSSSMEKISATVKTNAQNAQQANTLTNSTRGVADRSGEVVAEAVTSMSRIEESSRQISDIITVIDEIARQTNLLALNAAVEAARAGRCRPRLCGGGVGSAQSRATLLGSGEEHQRPNRQELESRSRGCRPGQPRQHGAERDRRLDQAGGGYRVRHRGGERRAVDRP